MSKVLNNILCKLFLFYIISLQQPLISAGEPLFTNPENAGVLRSHLLFKVGETVVDLREKASILATYEVHLTQLVIAQDYKDYKALKNICLGKFIVVYENGELGEINLEGEQGKLVVFESGINVVLNKMQESLERRLREDPSEPNIFSLLRFDFKSNGTSIEDMYRHFFDLWETSTSPLTESETRFYQSCDIIARLKKVRTGFKDIVTIEGTANRRILGLASPEVSLYSTPPVPAAVIDDDYSFGDMFGGDDDLSMQHQSAGAAAPAPAAVSSEGAIAASSSAPAAREEKKDDEEGEGGDAAAADASSGPAAAEEEEDEEGGVSLTDGLLGTFLDQQKDFILLTQHNPSTMVDSFGGALTLKFIASLKEFADTFVESVSKIIADDPIPKHCCSEQKLMKFLWKKTADWQNGIREAAREKKVIGCFFLGHSYQNPCNYCRFGFSRAYKVFLEQRVKEAVGDVPFHIAVSYRKDYTHGEFKPVTTSCEEVLDLSRVHANPDLHELKSSVSLCKLFQGA